MKSALVALAVFAAAPAMAAPDPVRLEHLLRQDCGACHGMTLKGGLGSPLLPEALAGKSEASLAQTILDGRPGTAMPPWRGLLSEEEVQWIVHTLKEAKP